MKYIASPKKTSRKISPVLGIILGAMMLLLVIGGYQFVQFLNPGQKITPSTVQKLEEVPILMRHDLSISSIVFNPRQNADISFVSSSDDGMIKLWHLGDGATEVFAVRAGRRLAFSSDGKMLVTTDSQKSSSKLWDLTQITNIFHSLKNSQNADYLSFSPDGQTLASSEFDGTITLWNWRDGQAIRTLKADEIGGFAIAFSPDDQTLASSSDDGITLWNWRKDKLLHTLKGNENEVRWIAFSPNGQTLASSDFDGKIKLWNWREGKAIRTLRVSSRGFGTGFIAFSPDGQTLAGSSDDGIKQWNWSDGTERFTLKEGKSPFAFSPDGQTLASDSDNGTIKLWNRSDGRLIRSFKGREKSRTALTFSPNGQTLVSASNEGITLWNQSDGTESLSIPIKEGVISAVLSPNGQTLAISTDETIKLLKLDYQEKLAIPLNVNGRIVAFSPDNQNLILANLKQIKLLGVKDRREIPYIKAEPGEYFYNFALSPNAQILATTTLNGLIKLRNLQEGKLIHTLAGDDKRTVLSLAFSPDGQMLAIGNFFESNIQLWNLSNGKRIHRWEANRASRVVFSPDGQLLASGSGGEIQLWNPQTGKKLRTLKGHASRITALAFSPDGQTLVSGSGDATIKLWRVKQSKAI